MQQSLEDHAMSRKLLVTLVLSIAIALTLSSCAANTYYPFKMNVLKADADDDNLQGYCDCMCKEGQLGDRDLTHFYVVLSPDTTNIELGAFEYHGDRGLLEDEAVNEYNSQYSHKSVVKMTYQVRDSGARIYGLYMEDVCKEKTCLIPMRESDRAKMGDLDVYPGGNVEMYIYKMGTLTLKNEFLKSIDLGEGKKLIVPIGYDRTVPSLNDYKVKVVNKPPQLVK
jgi:hypothetical protein